MAVLVGTAPESFPVRPSPPLSLVLPIRTLWGELAASWPMQAGQPELYELIRGSRQGCCSPPGSRPTALFDACGPCVILIDELVAYARKLYHASDKLGRTFDAVLSFVKLTEAARASKIVYCSFYSRIHY